MYVCKQIFQGRKKFINEKSAILFPELDCLKAKNKKF